MRYLSEAGRNTLAGASYAVLIPPTIPAGWLGPGITSPRVRVPSPFSLPGSGSEEAGGSTWSLDFSNGETAASRADTIGVVMWGGPPQECTEETGVARCDVFESRGAQINKGEGNDDKGLYFWNACETGFAVDLTKLGAAGPGTGRATLLDDEAKRIIPTLVPVASEASDAGC